MDPARCAAHGLIVADDGRCVICRRLRVPSATDTPAKTVSDTTWVVIAAALALAGMGGYIIYKDPFSTHVQPAVAPAAPVRVEVTAPEPAPTHRAPIFAFDTATAAPPMAGLPPLDPNPQNAVIDAAKKLVQIKMYTVPGDERSDEVRTYLRRVGYAFTEFDVKASPTDMVELKAINPSASIPTLDVDGNVLTTVNKTQLDDLLDRTTQARLQQVRH